MKTISPKKLFDLRAKGGNIKVVEAPVSKPPIKKIQSVEASLKELNVYVKQLATKKDVSVDTAVALKHVTSTMAVMLDKLSALSKPTVVKSWDIKVSRDEDQLIKSLKLEAIK